MTSRDELEAVTRRALTDVVMAAAADPVPTAALNRAVSEILTAAGAYASGDSPDVAALRRDALGVRERRQLAAAVHLGLPCPHPHGDSCQGPLPCGGEQLCRSSGLARTADTSLVTCRGCIRTTLFAIESGRQAFAS